MLWLIEKNFFDQTVTDDITTYDNTQKNVTNQGDDYTTGCLIDLVYLRNYYKMIAINFSKQQALHAHPKAIQQINFNGNKNGAGNTTLFFIIDEIKETILGCSQGTVTVLYTYFALK